MTTGEGQGRREAVTTLHQLAQRMPWLSNASFTLLPFGLVAGYGWSRLGRGRLHGLEYQCVLLTAFSVILALLGLALWIQLRARNAGQQRWASSVSACLVFIEVFLALYLSAQGICGWINMREASRVVRTGSHSDGTSYQSSQILGHMPKRNVTSGARLVADGAEIFDYTYHIDNFRRRITPASNHSAIHPRAVVFFGDSFTFGEGVNDDATLPNQVAIHRPDLAVYNYAFSGYGPNHMLARLESLDTRAEVPEASTTGVYVFIPNHVRRVIGAFSVISWSRHSPWYHLGGDGLPERLGSFQGERKGLTEWYDFLKGDQVVKYFNLDFPFVLSKTDFDLTEAIIVRSAELYKSQFRGGDFYVVLYPGTPVDEFPAGPMGQRLKSRGLHVLDYTTLLSGEPESNFFLPFDTHPRPVAQARVALELARDLPAAEPVEVP